MNSFAHYAFGAVGQWIFETIGGINTDGPGFHKTVIQPRPGGQLTWAKTSYRSIRGAIRTDWHRRGTALRLDVAIPANTSATGFVPSQPGTPVTEGGRPAEKSPSVTLLRRTDNAAVYEIGSGQYSFSSVCPLDASLAAERSGTR